MKLSEVTFILGQAASVFQNVAMTEPTLRMWHKLFENEEASRFQAAMIALTKESGRVFFPTPGEVVAMLQRMNDGDKAPGDLWEIACDLARAGYDTERMVERMSEISQRAARALRSIGWDRVRYTDFSQLQFVRKDFLEAMQAYEEHDHEQTTRLEASAVLAKIARNIGGADRGGLAGFQQMAGVLPAPTANGSDGGVRQNAKPEQRAVSSNQRGAA